MKFVLERTGMDTFAGKFEAVSATTEGDFTFRTRLQLPQRIVAYNPDREIDAIPSYDYMNLAHVEELITESEAREVSRDADLKLRQRPAPDDD